MIGENLLRFNKKQKYILWDCETCNLNLVHKENKPWQYAWIEATLDGVISRHEFLVKWDKLVVSKKAAMLTGFNQAKVDLYGISPKEALERINSVIYDPQYLLFAHNGFNFDIYIHNIHRKLMGQSTDYSYLNRSFDTNALARAMKHNVQPQEGENLFLFQEKFVNTRTKGIKTSIEALCRDFGIDYDHTKAHEALYDCELLRQIWGKLVWQINI